MAPILPKHAMSEEDIKLQYITPALTSKWNVKKIAMEAKVTDGKINLKGNLVFRERAKRADYLLHFSDNNPIAVVEAKDNKHSISYGLQQAMAYAQMLDVPFAYSSNGDGFAEHDFLTGKEREFGMDEFPTEAELMARYKEESAMTPAQEAIAAQPYFTSQNTYPPRYYQRIAINRTVDAIARGQNRLLLVMATGTGKTYTAFQIVYRLLQSDMKKKILYLADRNILVDQSIQQDFAPLEKVIHKINVAKDDRSTITSHQVYFSLYQQLVGDDDKEHFSELFSPDFFDLIIVDECHRGSAKEESRWRKILEYFSGATQIGMTATPKETKYISNLSYFGEPVYTYSLKEGIEDGFLAPFKVINIMTDIGDGWRPRKGQRDIYGNEIDDRIYTNSDYDYNIPFDIPESWTWVRTAQLVTLNPKNDLADDVETAFIPMPCVMDGFRNQHTYEVKKWKEIKKGFTHFAEGDIAVAKITPCFQNRKSVIFRNLPNGYGAGTTELTVMRTVNETVSSEYLLWFFKTDYFISNGVKSFTGTAGQQRVHKDYIATCLIPLPPLAEQKRIVTKIEELMPYIDRYEQAWSRLEDFNKRFPVDMQKSILQMTIQGKLVEQRSEEGMGEDVFQKMKPYHKGLKPCKDELDFSSMDFDIPESWMMVELNQLFDFVDYLQISPERCEDFASGGVRISV